MSEYEVVYDDEGDFWHVYHKTKGYIASYATRARAESFIEHILENDY